MDSPDIIIDPLIFEETLEDTPNPDEHDHVLPPRRSSQLATKTHVSTNEWPKEILEY